MRKTILKTAHKINVVITVIQTENKNVKQHFSKWYWTKQNLMINPDENPEHAMDYWKLEKPLGKNVPDENSQDFFLVFVNSKKKSRV
jgi:hypothetical protein